MFGKLLAWVVRYFQGAHLESQQLGAIITNIYVMFDVHSSHCITAHFKKK